jgi:hypothetical protein
VSQSEILPFSKEINIPLLLNFHFQEMKYFQLRAFRDALSPDFPCSKKKTHTPGSAVGGQAAED